MRISAVLIRKPHGLLMGGHPPYTGKYFAMFLQASLRTRRVLPVHGRFELHFIPNVYRCQHTQYIGLNTSGEHIQICVQE